MRDDVKGTAWHKGLPDDGFPYGPPTAVINHRGIRLELRFAPGDFAAEGNVQSIRVLPGDEPLEPRVLRRFAPDAELYLAYARRGMRLFGPEGTAESRTNDLRAAVLALRDISGPGRGLPDAHYETIATHYKALVDEGEPHPIKALSEIHHITISGASRWVKGARDRGYLPAATPAKE